MRCLGRVTAYAAILANPCYSENSGLRLKQFDDHFLGEEKGNLRLRETKSANAPKVIKLPKSSKARKETKGSKATKETKANKSSKVSKSNKTAKSRALKKAKSQIKEPKAIKSPKADKNSKAFKLSKAPKRRVLKKAKSLNGGSNQRVVLLVGPHKTSSSSVQTNIIRWTSDNTTLPDWSWPQPKNLVGLEACKPQKNNIKIFYSYFGTLNGGADNKCLRIANRNSGHTVDDFISAYENEFRAEWIAGKSIVIGSEAMDFVSTEENSNNDQLLSGILNGLPWNSNSASNEQLEGSNDDVTVVVKIRTPRVDHLASLWHQCCMKHMSFYEYITIHLPSSKNSLHSLDSLRVAEAFLKKGIRVILVDMEGATEKGYDISNVVACDVLGARCTLGKQIIGDTNAPNIINVKNHTLAMVNVTDGQLALMEKSIRNYDCNFLSIMEHKKLTTLYPDQLLKIFDACQNIPQGNRVKTRPDLIEILYGIATGGFGHYESITT